MMLIGRSGLKRCNYGNEPTRTFTNNPFSFLNLECLYVIFNSYTWNAVCTKIKYFFFKIAKIELLFIFFKIPATAQQSNKR